MGAGRGWRSRLRCSGRLRQSKRQSRCVRLGGWGCIGGTDTRCGCISHSSTGVQTPIFRWKGAAARPELLAIRPAPFCQLPPFDEPSTTLPPPFPTKLINSPDSSASSPSTHPPTPPFAPPWPSAPSSFPRWRYFRPSGCGTRWPRPTLNLGGRRWRSC